MYREGTAAFKTVAYHEELVLSPKTLEVKTMRIKRNDHEIESLDKARQEKYYLISIQGLLRQQCMKVLSEFAKGTRQGLMMHTKV